VSLDERSSSAAKLTDVEAKSTIDVSSAMEATIHQCLRRRSTRIFRVAAISFRHIQKTPGDFGV
jgi:hypothetical protein